MQLAAGGSSPISGDDWTFLAAIGPTAAALLVLIGVALTLWQKHRTDRRMLWWARVQWAADRVIENREDVVAVGMAALGALADDPNRNKCDIKLLAAIADTRLNECIDEEGRRADVDFEMEE